MIEEEEVVPFTPADAVQYDGKDKIVHFMDYLEEKAKSVNTLKKFKCEFTAFDCAIDGLSTGEVIVITGHRKEGKTTFAESWLRSMLKKDPAAKAVILSYEMPPFQLLQKYKDDPDQPIYVPMNLQAANFEWLTQRCMEAKYKYMANIVMIDHLDHMIDMSVQQHMSLNIGGFMRRLKMDIAMKLNLAIILIAHQGQPKESKEPSVDTLRGSSSIGQESDATIVVMRKENLDAADMKEFESKYGAEKAAKIQPPPLSDPDDKSSAKLAIVKIDCHRRTGAWKWKKLFRKVGEFMEEV